MNDSTARTIARAARYGITLSLAAGFGLAPLAQAQDRSVDTPCPPLSGDLDPAGKFVWMYSVGNTSFDPDKITTLNSQMYLFPVYDRLVNIDANAAPGPMLATSWQVLDGGKVLEMKLREGWHYHDGTPFDAESVKANIMRSKTLPGSYNAGALSTVQSVDVVDAHTVRIHITGGAGALVNTLGGPAGMMMSPAAFDKKDEAGRPTGGSGAYRMTAYKPGAQVEYTAVDNYWDPAAQKVKKMVFLVSGDDNARLNAVISGVADSTFLRASMYEPAKRAGLVVCQRPSLSSYNLVLNTSRPQFSDKRVRKAISYAINREAIKQVTEGFCSPSRQMFPSFYFASNPELDKGQMYDPEKAKALLRVAGMENKVEFELTTINITLYEQISQVVQSNLAAVGIKTRITPKNYSSFVEDFTVKKTADTYLGEQKAAPDPSTITANYYLAGGFNNPGGFTTPEITALHEQAMESTNVDARSAIYKKLFAAVAEEAYPNITLCHIATPFAMNGKVGGVKIRVDGARDFRGVGKMR